MEAAKQPGTPDNSKQTINDETSLCRYIFEFEYELKKERKNIVRFDQVLHIVF